MKFLLAILALLACAFSQAQMTFTACLPESLKCTGSVFDASGNQVRTLFSGQRLAAGSYKWAWDGKDDDGNALGAGTYTFRLMHHNIRFSYSNLVNSATRKIGRGAWNGFMPSTSVLGLMCSGSNLVWNLGYNEGGLWHFKSTQSTIDTFDLGCPDLNQKFSNTYAECDGTYCYFIVQRFADSPFDSMILKYNVSTGAFQTFSGLTPDTGSINTGLNANGSTPSAGSNYAGQAIPVGTNSSSADHTWDLRMISVQQSGSLLAVSQPNGNRVYIFDKSTGLTARTAITTTNPTSVRFAQNGDLWVVSDTTQTTLTRYTDNGTSFDSAATATLPDWTIALACDPNTSEVSALIAGTIQQVRGYNASCVQQWTWGQLGGYSATSIVAADRIHVRKGSASPWAANGARRDGGSIDYQSDGKLWILDRSLCRFERITANRSAVDHVFTWAEPYNVAVDQANPNRMVASNYCGYTVDWAAKTTTLDRFWGYNYVDTTTPTEGIIRLVSSGAHLYGLVENSGIEKLCELQDTTVREIANVTHGQEPTYDASFNRWTFNTYGGQATSLKEETFAGLDGSNNPTWNAPTTYCSWLTTATSPLPDFLTSTFFSFMSNGAVALARFNMDTNLTHYRVGAVLQGGTDFYAKNGRPLTASIPFPVDGHTTTSGNGNAANNILASGEFMIHANNGEGYNASEAGLHNIYNKYGQYVDQIGHVNDANSKVTTNYVHAVGENGNSSHIYFGQPGGVYNYAYAMESQASAIVDWQFDNMASYAVSSVSGTMGTTVAIPSFASVSSAPETVGAASESDTFTRADSSTVGNGWSVLTGGSAGDITIKSNTLRAKNSYGFSNTGWVTNAIYRGSSVQDSAQKIYIPCLFDSTYLRAGTGEQDAWWTVFGRASTSTGDRVGVSLRYIHFTPGTPGSGTFSGGLGFDFFAVIGGTKYSLGSQQAQYIPEAGDTYSVRLVISGTSPTRLFAILRDETAHVDVLKNYTESYDTALAVSGVQGVSLGYANNTITKWESDAFTWANPSFDLLEPLGNLSRAKTARGTTFGRATSFSRIAR